MRALVGGVALVIIILGIVSLRASRKRDTATRRWNALFNHNLDSNYVLELRNDITDMPGWRVAEANQSGWALLEEWASPLFSGEEAIEQFPIWARASMLSEHRICALTGTPRAYVIVSPDRMISYALTAVPVSDGLDGVVTQIILRIRDISDREQHDVKLETAITRAEDASTAKSAILANTSHELRTPLNAIIGYSELMQLGISGALNAKQTGYIASIHQSGKHLLEVITDILDLAKIEAGQFELLEEDVDVRELFGVCIDFVRLRAAAKGVQLFTGPIEVHSLWAINYA